MAGGFAPIVIDADTLAKRAETEDLAALARLWGAAARAAVAARGLVGRKRQRALDHVEAIQRQASSITESLQGGMPTYRNPLTAQEKEIVSQLIARRKALGLNQEDVDHKIGWADRLTGKLEAGHRRASQRLLAEWAEALGVSVKLAPIEEERASA